MCVCVCARARACLCVCACVYACMSLLTNTCIHLYTHACQFTRTCVSACTHARIHTDIHTSVQTDSDRQSELACVGRHGVEAAAVLCIHRSIHEVQVRRLLTGQTHQRHLRCEDHFREVETSPHTLASKAGVCSWYACVCVCACARVCVCVKYAGPLKAA